LSDHDVMVTSGARLDASGTNGGGRVRIGGGYRGGEDLPRAARTYVAADAQVHADATSLGDGGTIVVWSDKNTVTAGLLSARGGASGGHGGQIETSSRGGLTILDTPDV